MRAGSSPNRGMGRSGKLSRRPSAMTPKGQTRVQLDAEFLSHSYGKLYTIIIPADADFEIAELRWKNYFAAMGESFLAGNTRVTAGDILTSVNGKNLQHLPFAEVCRRMDEAKQDAIGGDLKLVLRACHMSLNTSPRHVSPSSGPSSSSSRHALPQSESPIYTPWAPREPQEYSPEGRHPRQSVTIVRPQSVRSSQYESSYSTVEEVDDEGYDMDPGQDRRQRQGSRRRLQIVDDDQGSVNSANGPGSSERIEELFRAREEAVKRWERAVDEKEKHVSMKEGYLKSLEQQAPTPRGSRFEFPEANSPSPTQLQELADKERELQALRQQLKRKETLLQEKEAELSQEKEAIERRLARVKSKEELVDVEFDGEKKSVEEWLADVRERRKKTRQLEVELQHRQAEVEEAEAALKISEETLQRRGSKLTQREEDLQQQQQQLDERESKLLQEQAGLLTREQELKTELAALKAKGSRLTLQEKTLEAREQRLKEEEESILKRQQEMDAELHDFVKRTRGTAIERDGVKRQQEELEEQFKEVQQAAEKTRAEQKEVSAMKAALHQREMEAVAKEAALKEERAALEQERSDLEEAKRAMEQEEAALTARNEELTKSTEELKVARRKLEEEREATTLLQRELQAALSSAKEKEAALTKRVTSEEARLAGMEQRLERKEKLLVELLPEDIDLQSFELAADDVGGEQDAGVAMLSRPAIVSLKQREKEVEIREKALLEKEQHLAATERSLDAREAALGRFHRAVSPRNSPGGKESGEGTRPPLEEKYRMALEDRASTHRSLQAEKAHLRQDLERKTKEVQDLVRVGENLKQRLENELKARQSLTAEVARLSSALEEGSLQQNETQRSASTMSSRIDLLNEELSRAKEDGRWWQHAAKKEEQEGLELRKQVAELKEQLRNRGVEVSPMKDRASFNALPRHRGVQTDDQQEKEGDALSLRLEESLKAVLSVRDVLVNFAVGALSGPTQSAQLAGFVDALEQQVQELEVTLRGAARGHGSSPAGAAFGGPSPRAAATPTSFSFDPRAPFTSPIAIATSGFPTSPAGSSLLSPRQTSSATALASLAVTNGRLSAELDSAKAEIESLKLAIGKERRRRLQAEKDLKEGKGGSGHSGRSLVPALVADAWDDSSDDDTQEDSEEAGGRPGERSANDGEECSHEQLAAGTEGTEGTEEYGTGTATGSEAEGTNSEEALMDLLDSLYEPPANGSAAAVKPRPAPTAAVRRSNGAHLPPPIPGNSTLSSRRRLFPY